MRLMDHDLRLRDGLAACLRSAGYAEGSSNTRKSGADPATGAPRHA